MVALPSASPTAATPFRPADDDLPTGHEFERSAFVNCPFDEDYDPILRAVLFCLVRLGLRPRIATERSDVGEPRISKIVELIESSKYSIHDLSRCQAQEEGEYYRLNMPFELGLDFGCRRYGSGHLASKVILVLEEEPYRYQAAISDLAGSDIEAHNGDYEVAVRKSSQLASRHARLSANRRRRCACRLRGLSGVALRPAKGPRIFRRRHQGLLPG